jgi:starch-binding outer membrane protein, SusD/RagB family
MKRILFFGIAFSSLVLGACKKSLDTTSESDFTSEYVFGDESNAKKGVLGVYAMFNQDAFTSRISNVFMGNTDVEVGGVGASADNTRRDIWSFEVTEGFADLGTVWNNAYNAINRANECIEGINKSPIKDNPEMKQLLGEAVTLRAYWYYLLVNNWGDVPYKTAPTRAGDNFFQPRTGRDTILTNCINDLIAIEPDMMWAEQLDFGIERINREFVIGMIARMSLMRGGYWLYGDMQMRRKDDYLKYYEIANTYCKKLVELKPHTLTADFGQIFRNQCEFKTPKNEDVLFEVGFQPGAGDVAWCNGVRVDAGTHNYGSGSNYLSFPITYFHSFDTLDERLSVTCSIVYYDKDLKQVATGTGAIAPGKWNRLWLKNAPGAASAKGTGINWPLMRYADVLLMLAESENELNGPTGTAMDALKQVRRRAFPESAWGEKVDGYVAAKAASKETFFNAIVDERAWEFGGECLRKYDLARWNLFGKKISETRKTLTEWGQWAKNTSTPSADDLPTNLYYVKNSDGTITWLNKYTAGYSTSGLPNGTTINILSWLNSMYNSTTGGASDYILRQWRGYKDETGVTPVRYILPVHSSVVSGSQNSVYNAGLYGY